MVKHFIILSSSYSSSVRIAMHYIVDGNMDVSMLTGEVKKVKEQCGETVSISTHMVETASSDWDSVVRKDAFFKDVQIVDSLVGFVNLISQDRELFGIDIAKYILAIRKCTHLELEKLVYMCYADYLCKTGKRLFKDKIFAFKYGPVVETVLNEYKGKRDIGKGCNTDEKLVTDFEKLPARSRILFAEDGFEKIIQIEETLNDYSACTASKLVEITHVKNGPWDCIDKKNQYAEISDEVIMRRHFKEVEYHNIVS